jgi:predicted nucleic acid-binding Zn ribbon protein
MRQTGVKKLIERTNIVFVAAGSYTPDSGEQTQRRFIA